MAVVECHVGKVDEARIVDAAAERSAQRRRLLVDLLEHEVREPALLRLLGLPVDDHDARLAACAVEAR